VTNPCDACD